MPASYGDVKSEYISLKESVALHDASYLGRIKGTGVDVLDLLNRISTNKVEHLTPGEGVPTILTNEKGRIVDLISVHNIGDCIFVMTSEGMGNKVVNWIEKFTIMEDSVLHECSNMTSLLYVLGPCVTGLFGGITNSSFNGLQPYHSTLMWVEDMELTVIRKDLGDVMGYQILVSLEHVQRLWTMLLGFGVRPVGTSALETLRVESGLPSYGKEIDERINPLEAGLSSVVDFDKGCYIGQEVIARLDTYSKVRKNLVSLVISNWEEFPGQCILLYEGKDVGSITTLVSVPDEGDLIGLGYVRSHVAVEGISLGLLGKKGVVRVKGVSEFPIAK